MSTQDLPARDRLSAIDDEALIRSDKKFRPYQRKAKLSRLPSRL